MPNISLQRILRRLGHGALLVVAVGACDLRGQALAAPARLDVIAYALELRLEVAAQQLAGTAELRVGVLTPGAWVEFDLDQAMAVSAVRWQGRAVAFEQTAGRLVLRDPAIAALAIGSELALAVDYRGQPRTAVDPPWRGGFVWGKSATGQPWLASVGTGDGGRLWFPCQDDRRDLARFDLRVTVPKGLVAVSSGVLQGKPAEVGDQQVWHWRTDTPLLPAQLALQVGPFEVLRETFTSCSGAAVPVQWFVLPEHSAQARRRMPQFLDHLRVFEQLFGPYPFAGEKYGLVEVPYAGSAHPSLLAYGGAWHEEQFDALHCGLLAQAWWGNQVVVGAWRDLWLQEGFATYAQLLFREARFGPEAYWKEVWRLRTTDRAPLVPAAATTNLDMRRRPGGLAELQQKGARVLQTLRWQVGDERFFGLLAAWARRGQADHARRLVTTVEFAAHCQEFLGEDLRWFVAAYLAAAPLPVLTAERRDGVLQLQWQVELPADAGAFELEVPVHLGAAVHRVAMAGGRGEIVVGDREYLIDPDVILLAVRGQGVR